MLRKRGKILFVAGCLLVIVAVSAFLTVPSGPRYDGRTLSEWLMIYYESDRPNRDAGQRPVADAAIRAIGTNALPTLLEWIRYETPAWHRDLARVMPRRIGNSQLARATIYRGFHRSEIARTTFPLLGTNALGAIPQLRSMMHDTSHPQTAVRSIAVLSRVGPEAFEIMEGGLGDTNQPFREQIAMMMGIYTARYVGTNACLSPLRTAMVADPDSKVRAAASNMVLRLAGTNGGADSR